MNEFVIQDENVILLKDYAEIYIPSELFKAVEYDKDVKSAISYMYGDAVTTLGVFYIRFADSEESISKSKFEIFNYPTMITTYPDEIIERNMTIHDNQEEEKYTILKYEKGAVICNAQSRQSSDFCEKFMNVLIRGKLPRMPYEQVQKIWEENYIINNIDPGVPAVTLQMIISEIYRYAETPRLQFRKAVGSGKVNSMDYVRANMRQVAAYTAVFNALTFESITDMLTTSLNISMSGEEQSSSPVEKVLAM